MATIAAIAAKNVAIMRKLFFTNRSDHSDC